METGLIVRDAVSSDTATVLRFIKALATFERLAHEVTATEAELQAALFGEAAALYAMIAEVGGSAVGLALYYYTFNTFQLRRNIFLEDLFVEPAHRGARVGFALMHRLARKAVSERCGRIEWRVLHWNQHAIDFYERIGASKVEAWQTRQLDSKALVALAKGTSYG